MEKHSEWLKKLIENIYKKTQKPEDYFSSIWKVKELQLLLNLKL